MAPRAARCALGFGLALLGPTAASAESSVSRAPAPPCKLGVVGAGWGGVYTAWRLGIDADTSSGGIDAKDVCVFEAYSRPGGRTYGARIGDYVVDVGAYRFSGGMHLPADLIERALKMPSVCYDPTCNDDDIRKEVTWPYAEPLKKVVDFAGRNVGYSAPLEAMLGQLRLAGARLHFDSELVGIHRASSGWQLHFSNGHSVEVATVVLNVPRGVLAKLDGFPQAVAGRWPAINCTDRSFPKGLAEGRGTVKVYAVYEEAWWVSRLGLLRGTAEEMHTDPPVSIHYHDGEVLCRGGVDAGGEPLWRPAREVVQRKGCRGVLQVFYRHSQLCPASNPGCMEYWAGLPRANASDPLTIVGAESKLAQVLHSKLLSMHAETFEKLNVSSKGIKLPSAVAYSVWTRTGMLPEGDRGLQVSPEDVIFSGKRLPEHCGASSVPDYLDMVEGVGAWAGVAPHLHLVNNDFSASSSTSWHGPWAEMSLLGAERILRKAFNLSRPTWLNGSYYEKEVLRTTPRAPAVAGSLLV